MGADIKVWDELYDLQFDEDGICRRCQQPYGAHAGFECLLPPTCVYCGKPTDGAMLVMGKSVAHVPCVIRKLNGLLDPDYDGEGGPREIIRLGQRGTQEADGQDVL